MAGIFITKPGHDVLTETDPQNFYFRSDNGSYLFLDILTVSLSVSDNGGGGSSTVYQIVSTPVGVNYFPYYFTWFPSDGMGGGATYDEAAFGGVTRAWVDMVTSGQFKLNFAYPSGGSIHTTVIANIYCFGNKMA